MESNRQGPVLTEETLFGEYKAVYRYVLTLCRNQTQAQDITQETFLKAVKAIGQARHEGSLYAWLCTIAKNQWLNQCRRQNRETDFPDQPIPSGEPPLEERLADRDASRAIHRVLHRMQEPHKEVFTLRVFGELPFGEIAALFGRTESWARVTYHRARKKIIEELRKEGML